MFNFKDGIDTYRYRREVHEQFCSTLLTPSVIVREPMTKRFFFLPRKVWVHFWNREPMVVTGSPVWLGAVGAFRSYRLPNSAGIDILSPNFLIHHFNTQNRELKVVSIPEGPDRIYGAVC